MVVNPIDYNFRDFGWFDILNQWLCLGAIYLQFVLMKKEKVLETLVVLALAPLVFYVLFHTEWLIYLSMGFLITPLISLKIALAIAKIWHTFSNYLGLVMNHALLFICFYLFLVPLSFFQRLFGANQILKKEKSNSYFQKRNHVFTKEDIKNPW